MKNSWIDQAILSIAERRWLKVARVIVDVPHLGCANVPDTQEGFQAIANRIGVLAREGRLIARGDLSKWRHSEIRLPGPLEAAPEMNACTRNLRLLSGVKHIWALENHKRANHAPKWADLLPYLGKKLRCPLHGTYTLGSVGEPPTCSYGRTHRLPQ